jgi:uncharacterized protein YecT (DUF1311 family)
MRKVDLAFSLPLLLCSLGHAASFDCSKAKTAQEKAICASPQLSAADDQMAAAYKEWLAAAQPAWADGIRQNQLAWLRQRDANCPADDADNPIAKCLNDMYLLRTDELLHMVQQFSGMTFVSESITLTAPDPPSSLPPDVTEITPGFGTLQASWPQASSTAPQWTAWNAALVPAMIQVANADQETSAHEWKDIVQPAVDRGLNATVNRLNSQWVSVTIVDSYDGHGAHPVENSTEFNWMLGPGRPLKPEDIFQPNSGWEKWMEQRLDGYLHQALDATSNGNYQTWFPQGNAAQVLQTIVTNPGDWKLEPDGLTLFFQPYQVACYACTPDPLTITWSDLRGYLQPGFVLPQ